jgi:membrane protease YdiL (CAAX protease family)
MVTPVSTVTASTPDRMERRRGGRWTALTVVELALAVGAVLIDLFLPALVLVVLAGVSLLARREPLSTLGFHRLRPWGRCLLEVAALTVAWTALMFLVVMPVVEHVTGERQDVSQFAELEGDVPFFLTLIALTWTLAAVGEELAFRGFLLTRITDLVGHSVAAKSGAIVVVALLFASIHDEQGLAGMVLVFVDAVFYGVLRYAYRSLWAPIVAHGLGNTIGLTTYFLLGPVQTLW